MSERCPICSGTDWRADVVTTALEVFVCRGCGLAIGRHLVEKAGRRGSDYDHIWQEAPEAYVSLLASLRRTQANRWEKILRERFDARGTVLDFGTGRGWFTRFLHEKGWSAHGADSSATALEYLKRDGIPATTILDFRRLPELVPDIRILTALDVVEHFAPEDLPAFIDVLKSLRKLEGVFIKVPRSRGFFYRLARLFATLGKAGPWHQLWQVGTFPPHYTYFDEKNLRRMLEKAGFRVELVVQDPDFEPRGLMARIASLPRPLRVLDRPLSAALWVFVRATGLSDSVAILASRA